MGFFQGAELAGPRNVVSARSLPKCGKCGLARKCISPKMEPTGDAEIPVMFVAEAPGETEDRLNEQLVGTAGQKLREILDTLDVDLDDCIKTNAIICRPPNNKMDDRYIEYCRPNLLKAIDQYKPKVIVLLGASSIKSLIPMEQSSNIGSVGKWVGWQIPSAEHGAWLCPTWHPSYLCRMNNSTLDMLFARHLEAAFRKVRKRPKSLTLDKLKESVECITSTKNAVARLRDLAKLRKGTLAFDYETTGLKPDDPRQEIVSCSFCIDGKDTFAVLTKSDRVMRLISRILRNEKTKKVASNLKFEERWTMAKLGHPVANWHWDTMQAAHLLDNRPGITSIKFQAYIYLGVPDYDRHVTPYLRDVGKTGFNRVKELPDQELLLYNAIDSLVEYLVAVKQKRKIK